MEQKTKKARTELFTPFGANLQAIDFIDRCLLNKDMQRLVWRVCYNNVVKSITKYVDITMSDYNNNNRTLPNYSKIRDRITGKWIIQEIQPYSTCLYMTDCYYAWEIHDGNSNGSNELCFMFSIINGNIYVLIEDLSYIDESFDDNFPSYVKLIPLNSFTRWTFKKWKNLRKVIIKSYYDSIPRQIYVDMFNNFSKQELTTYVTRILTHPIEFFENEKLYIVMNELNLIRF